MDKGAKDNAIVIKQWPRVPNIATPNNNSKSDIIGLVQIKSEKGNNVIVANKVRKITIEWVLSVFVRFLAIKYEIAKNIVLKS